MMMMIACDWLLGWFGEWSATLSCFLSTLLYFFFFSCFVCVLYV